MAKRFGYAFHELQKFLFSFHMEEQTDVTSGQIFKTYTPLLNGLDESNPDFLGKPT